MILLTARGCLLSSVSCLLPLCKVAHTPVSTGIRNLPSKVSSLVRTGSPLLYLLQYPDHSLRGCRSPHLLCPPFVRRPDHQLGLISPSSRSSAQASRTYPFATWRMKEVVRAVRGRQFPTLQWMPPIVLRARSWYTPFVLSLWRESRVCHRRPTWSPTWMMPLDSEEMGEGAVRCLITKSTTLLIGHTSTIPPCRPQAIGKKSKFRILEILWALACLPPYIFLYINWEPSLFLAYRICTSARRSFHVRNRTDPQ